MLQTLTLHAPAKLNLALSAGPAAPEFNGFHPIASWMQTVDLFDDLTLTRLPAGTLSRYAILWHREARRPSEIDWPITKDLAVRAHRALEGRLARVMGLPVQMKLEKRIPVGGGLGGGSSDAAAMLRGLNELFALGLSLDELAAVGATLGSDVPFLVHGGSAIVEGLGDRITPHAPEHSPRFHAVLVFPEAQCPTAGVYGLLDEAGGATLRPDAVRALASGPRPLPPGGPFNDLAEPAMRLAPQLREHRAALARLAERPAHITGSGSTLFVVCDDRMHAIALAEAIERRLSLPAVAVQSIAT
jgi:4-diphosphocytidyl-2-C-methyl-D-erythritol kinase